MSWIYFFVCIFLTFSQITGSGIFELRLKSFRNDRGLNSLGRCCGEKQHSEICQINCKTRFRICLKNYQAEIDLNTPCTFGAAATPVIGENSFRLASSSSASTSSLENFGMKKGISLDPIGFPFEFLWPGAFTLVVEAYHDANDSASASDSLIARFPIQGNLNVNESWTQYTSTPSHLLHGKEIEFDYRVTCAQNYYGTGCDIFCRERDDTFGHNACSPNGEKICLSGWQGEYCTEPRCSVGCNLKNGHCQKPNECLCKNGYKGANCEECEVYPGCVHGTCNKKWECVCKDGWGGLLCNNDLNFCTNHKPCHNGGTCSNTGVGSYTCKCLPGFIGTECEIQVQDCSHNSCLNDGVCIENLDHPLKYSCECKRGWTGRHCEKQTVTCASKPCKNSGVCNDTKNGFKCECRAGFGGKNCEFEIQNCTPNPCLNGKCIDLGKNLYECRCQPGFEGRDCEDNIDECLNSPCKNGGECVDGINQFKCKCTDQFIGNTCDEKVDVCLGKPCANGGKCRNRNNRIECICRDGFSGSDCSIDNNECESNPCRNGAKCIDRVNSYECQCTDGYQGTQCDEVSSSNRLHASTLQEKQIRSPDENLSGSQIALIAIFSIAVPVIAICGIATAICMKRRRKREQEKDDAEARKQNEQNASHISHINQHHHNSIIATKRASHSLFENSTSHQIIKNTWDKTINNLTNSTSMDDSCLTNIGTYGSMSNSGGVDNASSSNGTSHDHLIGSYHQSNIITPNSLRRAKSQKQLNTDNAVLNRASTAVHLQSPTSTKQLSIDTRISNNVEATPISWSGSNNNNYQTNNNNSDNIHGNHMHACTSRSLLDRS